MKKGFAIGSTVAINADLTWAYGSAANVIAEVSDVRLAGGAYLYTLASLNGDFAGANIIAEDVPFEDLREVRS